MESLLPAKSAPQISPTLPIGMRMHITPEYLWLQTNRRQDALQQTLHFYSGMYTYTVFYDLNLG